MNARLQSLASARARLRQRPLFSSSPCVHDLLRHASVALVSLPFRGITLAPTLPGLPRLALAPPLPRPRGFFTPSPQAPALTPALNPEPCLIGRPLPLPQAPLTPISSRRTTQTSRRNTGRTLPRRRNPKDPGWEEPRRPSPWTTVTPTTSTRTSRYGCCWWLGACRGTAQSVPRP